MRSGAIVSSAREGPALAAVLPNRGSTASRRACPVPNRADGVKILSAVRWHLLSVRDRSPHLKPLPFTRRSLSGDGHAPSTKNDVEHVRVDRGRGQNHSVGSGSRRTEVSRTMAVGRPARHRRGRGDRIAPQAVAVDFSRAPSGITPWAVYRHNAIASRRARATIPIRRKRLPPPPNRA